MSHLIVVTFDDPEEAAQVRESLRKGEHAGRLSLDDSAIVVKDQDGKIHVKNELDRGVKVGALGGGLLGLLIGGLIFPIGGLVLGALGGALVGSAADLGVSKKFVKEVSESMTPGSSAIFFIVREADPTYALAVMRNYEGQVFQTTLSQEDEEQLRKALQSKK